MDILKFPFIIGKEYSRKNVKAIIKHPEPESTSGNWGGGYPAFDECFFIFANLGTAGRTGHDYPNLLVSDSLYWFSNGASIHTPTLKLMMSGEKEVYIFTRENSSNVNFVFQGLGYVKDFEDIKPAHVVWGFIEHLSNVPENFKEKKRKKFIEGARRESTITRYERNPEARQECLNHYGYECTVCNMNFEDEYGPMGKDYIHVHHEVEISSIGEEYEINPIEDLKPVCPNCHAMLHKRKPAYLIEELKEIYTINKYKSGGL